MFLSSPGFSLTHYTLFWLLSQVKLSGVVLNKGWNLEHVDYKDNSIPEKIRIRGFKIEKVEQLEIN